MNQLIIRYDIVLAQTCRTRFYYKSNILINLTPLTTPMQHLLYSDESSLMTKARRRIQISRCSQKQV